jgi:broad specificity phosphatase PhoE
MLPIWNTYSFFTTYANIDGWTPDETEVWFTRHGETTANALATMSDGTDDPELTEKWREEAKNAGKTLLEQGKNFDIIIHTDLIRAHDTARIIGKELRFSGEYIIDDRFLEQAAGEYAGKTLQEIADKHCVDVADHPKLRSYYKNNSLENLEAFEKRINDAYADILEKYRGKKILIVGHAGTPRPIIHSYFGKSLEDAHYHTPIQNAEPFRLMTTPLVNDLDRWILSKLQVLMGQVHDAMDGYDVSRACRAIVEYMDHMTNWYVRLSRRRFWESGMTADKKSAYETLYTVLTELSKLLAPYMPFLSEDIFRGLTQKESVHLEYITRPSRHLIDSELNRDMEKCENIVSLGLALRSQKNIRVRQPLQSVTITADLSEYYQAIIRDELNVKEIKLENPEKLAKKIAKPDAKKIGPKYGKEVQSIIVAAKNGEFTELTEGKLQVGNFILEAGEYTLEYLPLEGVGDVIGGSGMVVAMDTTITEDLKLEGYARDIIRLIQDMRKEADYTVTDRISLSIIGEKSDVICERFGDMIQSETLSTLVGQIDLPDAMREESIDEDTVMQIAIKR